MLVVVIALLVGLAIVALRYPSSRWPLSAAGVIVAAWLLVPLPSGFGFDAHSYWGLDFSDLYRGTQSANGFGVFRYSPAFAEALAPFSALPFTVFLAGWVALSIAALVWLGRGWALAFCAIVPFVPVELVYGNIHLLLAAAIVLGFRYPWTWSLVLLTKVTPGIGLLWFAARREWRNLAIAIGATLAIVAVSAAFAPDLWFQWFASLAGTEDAVSNNHVPIPLAVRLPIAAALVVWAARTDRPWVVPLAAMLALPTIWTNSLSMVVGALSLALATQRPRIGRWAGVPAAAAAATV